MERFELAFGNWVIKYRWWIILASFFVVIVSGSGTRFLSINNNMRVFFSEENPQLQALEALENTYSKLEGVIFGISPRDGNIFTRKTLTAIEELTENSWQVPYSYRVESISNYQHTRVEEDDLIVEDLVRDAKDFSEEHIKYVKKVALSEPQLVDSLISPSGHVTSIIVYVLMPRKSMNEAPEIAAFSRSLAKDLRNKYPEIDIYMTGGVMFDNAFGEASQDDMTTLVPAMFLTLVLITGFSLRSFAGTLGTLVVILISMITGMGLAGWIGISITPASINAPTIILTLAVADSVHVLVTIFQQMRLGKSKHEAIAESLRNNVHAIFLTSVTTAIGFLTMNFSDAPPFHDLGNIVAMGVVAAFLYSVLTLPSLMAVLPLRIKPGKDKDDHTACDWLANFIINNRKRVYWVSLVLIIILTSGISDISLNDNFVKYFSERYDIRKSTDFLEDNLTGADIIEYSLESGETSGISNPEYLTKVEEFANWYRKQPKVVHVATITDVMKRLNKNMHGDDESWYRIPERRDLAAQYLLLYEMSLPFGLDLNNQINVDKSATRMIVSLKKTNTTEQRELDRKAREWLKTNAPELFTYGSSLTIIWAHISKRNINSMLGASFGALILISALLIFALRSFKVGLLSLIPNLAPAFMAFGVWGTMVGQVGLGLSVIVPMTLGIVVDDTVHFLSKYLRARREHNMDADGAVRYSFHTVGTAMWITTAALVAGFMILTLSGYKMNADMGLMTAITISLALLLDFFFLPILLMKVDGEAVENKQI